MTQVQTQPHNPGSHLAPNAVPINNLVAMAAQVDMNGIIAIGVIDFEKKMEDCKVRINAQTDQVKKSIADREKNIQDTCTAAGMAVDIQAENDICAALAAAKFGKYITDAVVLEIDEQHQNIRVKVGINVKGTRNDSYHSDTLGREFKVAWPAEAKKELKALKADRETLKKLTLQMAEVHRALANIPKLERNSRANITRTQLEKTDEGRELLAQMSSTNAANIPQLLLTAENQG